jgi:hypothetical protein
MAYKYLDFAHAAEHLLSRHGAAIVLMRGHGVLTQRGNGTHLYASARRGIQRVRGLRWLFHLGYGLDGRMMWERGVLGEGWWGEVSWCVWERGSVRLWMKFVEIVFPQEVRRRGECFVVYCGGWLIWIVVMIWGYLGITLRYIARFRTQEIIKMLFLNSPIERIRVNTRLLLPWFVF